MINNTWSVDLARDITLAQSKTIFRRMADENSPRAMPPCQGATSNPAAVKRSSTNRLVE
jgi:hypothetical protein